MIKTTFFGALVLAGLATTMAAAPTHAARAERPLVDCSLESGTTKVCVVNERKVDIVGITCSGFWGTSDISVPGGSIPAGGMSVVDFKKGSCTKHLTIKFESGAAIERDGFDTSANTVLFTGKGKSNSSNRDD